MFDHTHYVPVIRWKAGEQWALRELRPETRRQMTPLLELMPNNFEEKKLAKAHGIEGRMSGLSDEIVKSWGRSPFFIDMSHVESRLASPSRPHPLRLLGNGLRMRALKGIPVTGINRSNGQKDAAREVAAELGCGIAVRIYGEEINASLSAFIARLLDRLGMTPSEIHLIVDQQLLNGSAPAVAAVLGRIPDLTAWSSVTFLSGAFPQDLSKIEKNTQEELPRTEWLRWKKYAESQHGASRVPTFGDYTVQHALYREPPPGFNASASIRYTAESYWVIMRGEGVRNDDGPGYDGYLGNAMLLIDRDEFRGPDFSAGDRYIRDMSRQSDKPGNPQTWIRAAINHHITLVVRQVASLTGS